MNIITIQTKVRGCGKRQKHGVYLVGGSTVSKEGVLAQFVTINPPIPYQVKFHRTPRIIKAYEVLGRHEIKDWWFGASKETEIKKAGDEWALETFGMTLDKRLRTGECERDRTADVAISTLASKIKYDERIVKRFRDLTLNKLQEIRQAVVPYNQLHESLLTFSQEGSVGNLMKVQAAVWRLVYALPRNHRRDHLMNLASILALMGLTKDSVAMLKKFSADNK